MAKNRIHNMDTLEKEILRLKLQQKDTELGLDRQWGKLRHNFGAMILNSFRRKKNEEEEGRQGFFESILKNEKVESTLHNISDKISGKLSGVISNLFERFFNKK